MTSQNEIILWLWEKKRDENCCRCAHSWKIFQHSKRNFVSPRGHVISSISLNNGGNCGPTWKEMCLFPSQFRHSDVLFHFISQIRTTRAESLNLSFLTEKIPILHILYWQMGHTQYKNASLWIKWINHKTEHFIKCTFWVLIVCSPKWQFFLSFHALKLVKSLLLYILTWKRYIFGWSHPELRSNGVTSPPLGGRNFCTFSILNAHPTFFIFFFSLEDSGHWPENHRPDLKWILNA